MKKHVRFIAIGASTYAGHWGVGQTVEEAKKNAKKQAGRNKYRLSVVYRFDSKLPFCPTDTRRDATEDEADAWVSVDGGRYWKRCTRTEIDSYEGVAK